MTRAFWCEVESCRSPSNVGMAGSMEWYFKDYDDVM